MSHGSKGFHFVAMTRDSDGPPETLGEGTLPRAGLAESDMERILWLLGGLEPGTGIRAFEAEAVGGHVGPRAAVEHKTGWSADREASG
jgi:hypothetical protein